VAAEPKVSIHPTAIVAPLARLGDRVSIGPYCVVGPNVVLGAGCILHAHVVIDGHTTVGDGNQFFPFCSVGLRPQDLKYKGEPSRLVLGNNNTIREYVTLQPGTAGGGMITEIGSDNLFMANSHLGHDGKVGDRNIIANSVALAGHVTLGSHVVLGGLAGVHQFAHVGDYAMAGAGSMISKDVVPFGIVQGDRAALVGVNVVGMERGGFAATDVDLIQSVFKKLFFQRSAIPLSQRVRETAELHGAVEPVRRLCEFISNSKRGVALAQRRDGAQDTESGGAAPE
jgi:UDP-N-acetylglucosamine acyltransferase